MVSEISQDDLKSLEKLKKRCIGRILEAKDDACYDLNEEDSDALRSSVIHEVNHLYDVMKMYVEHGTKVNQLFLQRMEEIHQAVVGDK